MSKHRYCQLTCPSIAARRAANTNQSIRNQLSHAIPARIVAIILGLSVSGLIGTSFIVPRAIATPLPPNSVQQNESTDLLNYSHLPTGTAVPVISDANSADAEVDPSPEIDDRDANGDTTTEQPRRQSSLGAALRTLREQLERQERPLGSRGAQCPYSPGLVGADDTIWSDRPVFLWRSTGQTLSLYDYDTDELLWQQQVEAGTEAVVYDGVPLQPGGLYRWVLMHPATSDFNATFMVMEQQEREALATELEREEERWTAAGLTPQEQAVERATFFGDRRLWSDALQELHVVRDSPDVDTMIREISVYLCGSLESDIQAQEQNSKQSPLRS